MTKFILISIVLIHSFVLGASESKVYFINLKDGDVVENPIFIQFGLSGKGVAPAGVDNENTGHHHLLIDVGVIDFSMPIPSSKNHLHFGGGPTPKTMKYGNTNMCLNFHFEIPQFRHMLGNIFYF